jgi:hypothetical protein
MSLGRSDAGLKSFSVYLVLQRMRASSRAQHVVSTIICRRARSSGANGDFGVKQGELFARSRPCSRRMNPTAISASLPRSSGVAVAARVFPVLWRAWAPECWRDVIVVGRGRKSSASFDAGVVSLCEMAAVRRGVLNRLDASCRPIAERLGHVAVARQQASRRLRRGMGVHAALSRNGLTMASPPMLRPCCMSSL